MAAIPKNKEGLGAGSTPFKEKSEGNLLREQEEKQKAKEIASSGQSSPFVRNYRGKNSAGGGNGAGGNGAYRMSMTIRPQTVANLASKFDTIVKDKQPASKNSRQGGGLKLRSYDITKIISELNKLNNNEGGAAGDQSRVKSKPKPGKNENHLPCDGSSGGSLSGTTVGDNREGRNLCGLGGDSSSARPSHLLAKTTASPKPEAAALRPSTLSKKTAEESHNNPGARQDAVGPVGSCRLPEAASICENNLAPSLSGRNADVGRSRCTSEEGTISLPAASASSTTASSSLPASSLASSSRGGKESRKGLAVSFSPQQQVSILYDFCLHV